MKIASYSVNRPITTMMIVISVVVIGLISLKMIPLLYLPEFSGHSLWMDIPYTSSSPQEVERLITIPIEDAISVIENIESMSSSSSASSSSVNIRFKIGTDMRLASTRVMDKIDEIRPDLPDDIDKINAHRFQSGDLPVIEFQVAGDMNRERLFEMTETVIKRRLQRIDGVASVETRGINEKRVFIELDQERMRSHNLDAYALWNMMRTGNPDMPAGVINDHGMLYSVRALAGFESVNQISELPVILNNADGQGVNNAGVESVSMNAGGSNPALPASNAPVKIIRLSDLSDVRYAFPKKTRYERIDGKDAITVRVLKASNANTIAVAKNVKMAIEELKTDRRLSGFDLVIYRDRGEPVIDSLSKLKNAGLIGGCLVIAILFVFLRNVRSTLIVVGAIPLSILSGFCLMFILRKTIYPEITLNVVSLSGMMLAIGILVDPAIVVLENIFRHRNQSDLPARQVAIAGASEVGTAIIASTATTISVFAPLLFLTKSRMGIFLRDFGVTVCITVVASLFIALTVVPLASSYFMRRGKNSHRFAGAATEKTGGIQEHGLFFNMYIRFVRLTLNHKWAAMGIATLIVASSVYAFTHLDKKVVWTSPYRTARIWVDAPKDYDIKNTTAMFEKLEKAIIDKKGELEATTVSSDFRRGGGILEVSLKPKEEARLSLSEAKEKIKSALPAIPGVKYSAARRYGNAPQSNSFSIEMRGKNIETLVWLGERAKKDLEKYPYILEADTNLQTGTDEIQVGVQREKASKFGVFPQRVAFGLRGALSSRAVNTLKTDAGEVDILMQIKEEDRDTLGKLKNMTFRAPNDSHVSVNTVGTLEQKPGARVIQREERRPTLTLSVNYKDEGMKKLRKDVAKVMNKLKLPPDYSWSMGRQFRRHGKEEKELFFGIMLAIIIIYLIMASLFESFVYPFTIMLSIPFAFTGVAFIFYALGIPLDDFAQIGMFLLCGIVVNNAIVLIDYINQLRKKGMEKSEAVLKGVSDRFRPILMTTLTTILGLMPMVLPMLLPAVFGQLEGRARMWAPLGLVVVAGLTTSTILTLVILPAFYSLLDDIAQFAKRRVVVARD